jgi:SOS-response transcriptional repressor LexA
MQAMARAMGYAGASSYQRYENPETYKDDFFVSTELAEKLIAVLVGKGTPPIERDEIFRLTRAYLLTHAGEFRGLQPMVGGETVSRPVIVGTGASGLTGPRDLPILGYAKAGVDGFFIVNGEVQGYTVRPDILQGVKDAYSVYAQDNSMDPAFKTGHLVWVDPLRPPRSGDDVVIQLRDGQAFLKNLVRRTEKALICRQHNPAIEVKFETANVKSVHLVVGTMRVQT